MLHHSITSCVSPSSSTSSVNLTMFCPAPTPRHPFPITLHSYHACRTAAGFYLCHSARQASLRNQGSGIRGQGSGITSDHGAGQRTGCSSMRRSVPSRSATCAIALLQRAFRRKVLMACSSPVALLWTRRTLPCARCPSLRFEWIHSHDDAPAVLRSTSTPRNIASCSRSASSRTSAQSSAAKYSSTPAASASSLLLPALSAPRTAHRAQSRVAPALCAPPALTRGAQSFRCSASTRNAASEPDSAGPHA
eukprot:1457556-Rhodomonas_salina.1